MERLTRILTKTVVYTKGIYEDTTPAEMTTEDVRTVLKKLAKYEDIGTPTELKQLKENGGFTGLELAKIAAALKELQAYRERGLPEPYKPKDTEVATWKNKVLDDFMKKAGI